MKLFRIYVGPIGIPELAEKLRADGIHVACEGTEHIHVESSARDSLSCEILVSESLGYSVGWHNVRELREVSESESRKALYARAREAPPEGLTERVLRGEPQIILGSSREIDSKATLSALESMGRKAFVSEFAYILCFSRERVLQALERLEARGFLELPSSGGELSFLRSSLGRGSLIEFKRESLSSLAWGGFLSLIQQ